MTLGTSLGLVCKISLSMAFREIIRTFIDKLYPKDNASSVEEILFEWRNALLMMCVVHYRIHIGRKRLGHTNGD